MMREDVRRARVDKYGSFLYCPERDTICSFRDTAYGACGREECIHEDPEWIELQERIEENRRKNRTKPEEPQHLTKQEILQREIDRKSAEARRCYIKGWTRKGDRLTYEIIHLERKLKGMGKNHDK